MRIIPTRADNGQWISPIPFMITSGDLADLIKDQGELKIVSEMLGKRLDNMCLCASLTPVAGCCMDPESENRARITNRWFQQINGTVSRLRDMYFQWVGNGDMRAGQEFEYSFQTRACTLPSTPQPRAETAERVDEFHYLISTRKLLGFLGVDYYDGPEFKFLSNRHPSPAESYIPTLAKEYMMQLVVPNALIALKHGKVFSLESAMSALDHCMTTGKSQESVLYWQALKADASRMNPILEKYTFYVLGKRRDGRDIEADHRCYFDKYVSLKAKDAKTFKKSRNQDVVDGLLKRMESEPELKTMSHRQLMAAGISDRPARMFMEARKRR